jgi:8-oxo-dGTP pyrophosphatase MutT (NUDIX family)
MSKLLAGCVITNSKKAILLLHRNTPRLTQWELPGGKLEDNETLAEAARREALEEIGVAVEILHELGQTEFVHEEIRWQYHWFRAEIAHGTPYVGEPDRFDALAYFDLLDDNAAKSMHISLNVVALRAALKNNQITL